MELKSFKRLNKITDGKMKKKMLLEGGNQCGLVVGCGVESTGKSPVFFNQGFKNFSTVLKLIGWKVQAKQLGREIMGGAEKMKRACRRHDVTSNEEDWG